MPRFSEASKQLLATCHPDLQRLMQRVVLQFDIKVISGRRTEDEQAELVRNGFSKTMQSKHLASPSLAVDVAPWPVDWSDSARFYALYGYVRGVAESLGIDVRCGADWDGDWSFKDQRFHDLGHYELAQG